MRFPFYTVLFLVFGALATQPAQGQEIAGQEIVVQSHVTKVTVFPAGAQLIREAKVNLVAGDQTIVVRDLPERLIRSSLRVEGVGETQFEIGAVDSKSILVDAPKKDGVLDKSERARLEKQIEQLEDEVTLLTSRIEAATTQRRLMERLADLPGHPPGRPGEGQGSNEGSAMFSVENWSKIFDLIGVRMAVADDLILKHKQQQRAKLKEITRLKKRLAQEPPKKERQTEIRVAISSAGGVKAGLKIKYQVREASWRPFYDARLATGAKGAKPQLALTRRAAIRQWSGEDWKNVKLSLSTTRPQQGAQTPVLRPKRLDLVTQRPLGGLASSSVKSRVRGLARPFAMEDQMASETAAPAPMEPPKKVRMRARERTASISQYAFQAVFGIPGVITVLPTGDEKKVAISSDKINPDLKIKTVPVLNSTAFLYAKFIHDKQATPLLPGAVALYRDGTFTGNSSMPLINGGDEHELGFGADDAVKVTRAEVQRTKGESGVFTSSKVDERRYNIKVINLHKTTVDVEVMDRIPYSVNEKVVVRLLPTSTRPSRQNIKDKRGIMAWDFTLQPTKEKLIKLNYSISWPADQQLNR